MALQKVFLLPPLKGLNLYDNPFTMSPDYAVELINFMPPTTTFSVRPAIKKVIEISGQIKGIYSYATGSCSSYGDNWYNSTIKYSGATELLIKTTATDGVTTFGKIDLSNDSYVPIATVRNGSYNDEHAMYKHTFFFVNGEKNSSCYLYNSRYGFAKFVLQIGSDGHENVNNMSNIVVFKNYLFFSTQGSSNAKKYWEHTPTPAPDPRDAKSENALNIFFIEAKYADVLDPLNSTFWKHIENLFAPHFASTFSIDGTIQNGGNIIKLCCISKTGSDNIASYLAAITDQGEIVLFDGTDPKDLTGQHWQVVGKFQIPPPLSKWSFCDMEGDLVVVTKNGLVSLRRVVFGQTTNVTENLEYKLMSLFSKYMFKIPSFSQFIGLFYHQRNRLLIFNVPTALPIPFNQIVVSYLFNYNTRLMFEYPQTLSEVLIDEIKVFLANFILANYLDYQFTIEFNGDYKNNNIVLSFITTMAADNKACDTEINFSITLDGVKQNFFKAPLKFHCVDVNQPTGVALTSRAEWDDTLVKTDLNGAKLISFIFPKEKDFIVTNFISQTRFFNNEISSLTLGSVQSVPRDISRYNKSTISDTFYNIDGKLTQSLKGFFGDHEKAGLSDSWSNWDRYPPVQPPFHQGIFLGDYNSLCYLMEKTFYDFPASHDIENDDLKAHDTYTGSGDYTSRTFSWNVGQDDVYTAYFTLHFDYNFPYVKDSSSGQYGHIKDGKVNYSAKLCVDKKAVRQTTVNIDLGSETINYQMGQTGGKVTFLNGWAKRTKYSEISFSGTSNIFPLSANSVLKYSKEHGTWNFTHNFDTKLSKRIEALILQHYPSNDTTFDNYYRYLFSYIFFGNVPSLPTRNESNEIKADPEPPILDTPFPVFNIQDLTILPIFNHINIACDFRSTQYVFDSHFGTWSSFEDVNMIKGVEHQNDFYFAVPNDIKYSAEQDDFTYTSSTICRFEPDAKGDQHGEDFYAIRCKYKTVPTFDFGQPMKKIFKRLKIFGTPSVFYQARNFFNVYPLLVTPFSDFKEGKKSYFIHSFDNDGITERVLKKHFRSKLFRQLSSVDKEKFWKAYKEENDMITEISMPIIANAGTRFGLEIEMIMNEAYMDIFGFDVYFELTNQIL